MRNVAVALALALASAGTGHRALHAQHVAMMCRSIGWGTAARVECQGPGLYARDLFMRYRNAFPTARTFSVFAQNIAIYGRTVTLESVVIRVDDFTVTAASAVYDEAAGQVQLQGRVTLKSIEAPGS